MQRIDAAGRDQHAVLAVAQVRFTPPSARPGEDGRLAARHGLEGRALTGRLAPVVERDHQEPRARVDVAKLDRRVGRGGRDVRAPVDGQGQRGDDVERQVVDGREERPVVTSGVRADAHDRPGGPVGRRGVPPEVAVRAERQDAHPPGWDTEPAGEGRLGAGAERHQLLHAEKESTVAAWQPSIGPVRRDAIAQPLTDVDERRLQEPRGLEKCQRQPAGVDSRNDDPGAVEARQIPEREVEREAHAEAARDQPLERIPRARQGCTPLVLDEADSVAVAQGQESVEELARALAPLPLLEPLPSAAPVDPDHVGRRRSDRAIRAEHSDHRTHHACRSRRVFVATSP